MTREINFNNVFKTISTEKKKSNINLYTTYDEYLWIKSCSKILGLSMSDFIRNMMMDFYWSKLQDYLTKGNKVLDGENEDDKG